MPLPPDATLATCVHGLKKPEEFVRKVFGNMAGYYRDCQVRLAADSNARAPDYVIEWRVFDEGTGTEVVHEQSVAVFSGRSHAGEVATGENLMRPWCLEAMTWREVQSLLGKLRGKA